MKIRTRFLAAGILAVVAAVAIATANAAAPRAITTPEKQFGHPVGADYKLLTYTQLSDYWTKLAKEASDRMKLVDIGKTAEGRTQIMAIITSPANHKRLARYQEIARRLALAEGVTDDEARKLAAEGRAVVWIDGGTHSSEIVNHQTMVELVYQMVSKSDAETLRVLDDVIMLGSVTNPDGMELVGDYYNGDPQKRNPWNLPELFHKYMGGDTNRDHYMSNQPETENINRVLYREWFPQILYNQHQTGPGGAVLFIPPFRDPFNYDFDPLIIPGIDMVGAAIQTRFIKEGKPGANSRTGANYSTWWEGCLRCGAYFHNAIGILTEINGGPTPMEITFVPEKQLPHTNLPFPIEPQPWHFRQAIEYIMTANWAILDLASKYRQDFLFNIYLMGKHSIEKGSRDNWTTQPKRIAAVKAAIAKDKAQMVPIATGGSGRDAGYALKYYQMLKDPALRDARGYIIPSNQPDFLTAVKFVNVLIKNGVAIHRATKPFQIGAKSYPEGSLIVKAAQAYRPHVRSMFEPQDHPDDIPYPGAAPIPPYDSAGWTLAYQMGVEFDKVFDAFDGPFEKLTGFAAKPAGTVTNKGASGFLLSHQVNDAFIATNRLLKAGEQVYWLKRPVEAGGKSYPVGTIYIPAKPTTVALLDKLAAEVGLTFDGVATKPTGEALQLKAVRIGLWDQYGGSSNSGWMRWMFDQADLPYEVVYPRTLDAGNLSSKYDVLIFATGAISPPRDRAGQVQAQAAQPDPSQVPEKYRDRLGLVTPDKTVPQLQRFLNDGGTIVTIGSSTSLAQILNLPISDPLIDKETGRTLPREKYYMPGSIHQMRIDNQDPLAYGLGDRVDTYFSNNPVFELKPNASGLRPVAWFDSENTLRSGWAWGNKYLKDTVAIIDADVGKGKLFLIGPEIAFRAQPHGTFKLLFNGIYYGPAKAVSF